MLALRIGSFLARSSLPLAVSVLCSVLVLVLVGCPSTVEPPPENDTSQELSPGIMPLKCGYYWDYEEYLLDDDSTVLRLYDSYRYRIGGTLKTPEYEPDLLYSRQLVRPAENSVDPVEWLFRNYSDGLYLMGGRTDTDTVYQKLLWLKFPANPGDYWPTQRLVFNFMEKRFYIKDTVTYTCVDTSTVFQTKIGPIRCVVYFHVKDSPEDDVLASYENYDYFSPQIGFVGRMTYVIIPWRGRFPRFRLALTSTNVPFTP